MSSPSDDTNESIVGNNYDIDDQDNEDDSDNDDDDNESFIGSTDLKDEVITCLSSDGWGFTSLRDTPNVFPDGF